MPRTPRWARAVAYRKAEVATWLERFFAIAIAAVCAGGLLAVFSLGVIELKTSPGLLLVMILTAGFLGVLLAFEAGLGAGAALLGISGVMLPAVVGFSCLASKHFGWLYAWGGLIACLYVFRRAARAATTRITHHLRAPTIEPEPMWLRLLALPLYLFLLLPALLIIVIFFGAGAEIAIPWIARRTVLAASIAISLACAWWLLRLIAADAEDDGARRLPETRLARNAERLAVGNRSRSQQRPASPQAESAFGTTAVIPFCVCVLTFFLIGLNTGEIRLGGLESDPWFRHHGVLLANVVELPAI